MVVSASKTFKWHLRKKDFTAVHLPLLILPSSCHAPNILCYFDKMGPYSFMSKAHRNYLRKWTKRYNYPFDILKSFAVFNSCRDTPKVANSENQNHCPWMLNCCLPFRVHDEFCPVYEENKTKKPHESLAFKLKTEQFLYRMQTVATKD